MHKYRMKNGYGDSSLGSSEILLKCECSCLVVSVQAPRIIQSLSSNYGGSGDETQSMSTLNMPQQCFDDGRNLKSNLKILRYNIKQDFWHKILCRLNFDRGVLKQDSFYIGPAIAFLLAEVILHMQAHAWMTRSPEGFPYPWRMIWLMTCHHLMAGFEGLSL